MKTHKRLWLTLVILPALLGAAPAGPDFDATQQAAIDAYRQKFETIGNLAKLVATYREALKLAKLLEPKLEKYMEARMAKESYPDEEELKALGARMPGLAPHLVAEGTMMALMPDYSAYGKIAARTAGTADDAYFNLMKKAYGSTYSHYPLWFNQTWDYGGCTWLGKGLETSLMKEVQRLRQAKNPFTPELKELEDEILRDLEQSDNFCLPRTQAIQELKQLMPLLPAAAKQLQNRLQQLQNNKPPKDRKFQFDCEGKNLGKCAYG